MIGSIVFATIEVMELLYVIRMPQISSRDQFPQLQEALSQIYYENKKELDELSVLSLYQKLQENPEIEKAVLMGNRKSVIYVYGTNLGICVCYFLIGAILYYYSKPTHNLVQAVQKDGYENVSKKLMKPIQPKALLVLKIRQKYLIMVALGNFILVFFATCLRILIVTETMRKEAKMYYSLTTM